IRDATVTGVQTCALPILGPAGAVGKYLGAGPNAAALPDGSICAAASRTCPAAPAPRKPANRPRHCLRHRPDVWRPAVAPHPSSRSEERRVGTEGRVWLWW